MEHKFLLLFFLTDSNSDLLHRLKRDYQDDPKVYLDRVIAHWIYQIPILIDFSVDQSEKDLRLTHAKRVTQVSHVRIKYFIKQATT